MASVQSRHPAANLWDIPARPRSRRGPSSASYSPRVRSLPSVQVNMLRFCIWAQAGPVLSPQSSFSAIRTAPDGGKAAWIRLRRARIFSSVQS